MGVCARAHALMRAFVRGLCAGGAGLEGWGGGGGGSLECGCASERATECPFLASDRTKPRNATDVSARSEEEIGNRPRISAAKAGRFGSGPGPA
jgi:hypothetical protein